MRILLVDDEVAITDGLRRAFFYEDDMEILTADSGSAGLQVLEQEQETVDVVISDMRMPRMDGAEFLKAVHERYPDSIRIVLSGHADDEAAMRVMNHAHQFVSKPCSSSELKIAIEHAMEMRAALENPAVRTLTGAIDKLPQAPHTFQALSRLIADDKASLADIAAVVAGDPALSAKLLQLVNSAFFSFAKPTTDVCAAVTRLGVRVVRSLALTTGMFEQANAQRLPIDLDSLNAASVQASLLAQQLVDRADQRDIAGSAALLAHLGILAICAHDRERWQALAHDPGGWRTDPAAELEAFGCTHAQVSAYLLTLWGLPMTVAAVVLRHHDAAGDPPARIDALSAVAAAHAIIETGALPPDWEDAPGFAAHKSLIASIATGTLLK